MNTLPLAISNFDISKFRKIRLLKQGGCGSIYLVSETTTHQKYVAKVMQFLRCDEETKEKMINREIGIMMTVNNPTLIKIQGFSRIDINNDPNITLIMDYIENGSLTDVLEKVKHALGGIEYSDTTRQIILIGISRGMKYLHDRSIIHRDLSSNNVLLDGQFHPIITDFGLSKFFDINDTRNQSFFGGTTVYTSPEILKKQDYDTKADVYSFGIIMYEVVTDSYPYPEFANKTMTETELIRRITEDKYRPNFPNQIKESFKDLITACWSDDPNDRPTFKEIFEKLSSVEDYENNREKSCFFDNVNISEIEDYVCSINEINDPIENLNKRLDEIEKENKELIQALDDEKAANLQLQNENGQLNSQSQNTVRFWSLFQYLSKLNAQSNKKIDLLGSIFIPNKAQNVYEISIQDDNEQIGFNSDVVEMLFSLDSFDPSELVDHLKKFSKIVFELRDSAPNIKAILTNISIINQQISNDCSSIDFKLNLIHVPFRASDWFKKLFGFSENVNSVYNHITIEKVGPNYILRSNVNGMSYNAGNFQVRYMPSYLSIQSKCPVRGGGTLSILVGNGQQTRNFAKIDVFSMQSLPENDGATYLASSCFNCLEFVASMQTANMGVTNYVSDFKQGSYTALACPQSAVLRNYFIEFGDQKGSKAVGQINYQINLLSKTPLIVNNGYAFINKRELERLKQSNFDWNDEKMFAVGVHSNCDVIMTRGKSGYFCLSDSTDSDNNLIKNVANHVYASSFNFNSDVILNDFTLGIARCILRAEYKLTIHAAWENSVFMEAQGRVGARRLYLTLLGGGCFGTPLDIIAEAIASCEELIVKSGLDVYVVCYDRDSFNGIKNILEPLVEKTNGSVIYVD